MPITVRLRADPSTSTDLSALGAGPWLVVAPHDDDALLGLGATMNAAARAGIVVHVVAITDGRMGWNDPAHQGKIAGIRRTELLASCAAVGIPPQRVHCCGFPDGSLFLHRGAREDSAGGGIGRHLVKLLRELRPGAVFCNTGADLHPDHQVTTGEVGMAVNWAANHIWAEFGAPIAEPKQWHYAVYCDFPQAPDVQIRTEDADLTAKLTGLACYHSQPFIDAFVTRLRADGPLEYLQAAAIVPYRPATYAKYFPGVTSAAVFLDDCRMVGPALDAWTPWPALCQLMQAGKLRLVGEGSSRLFPAGFLRHLARTWGVALAFDAVGGRTAEGALAGAWPVLLSSNSGATREVVEFLDRLSADVPRLALVGVSNGPLPKRVGEHRIVLPRPEQAIAATASVFLQAFTCGAALAAVAGKPVPRAELRAAALCILESPLPAALARDLAGVTRIWWADGETGVGDELALKTMETCGLPGIAAPGTMALHGLEEIFTANDRILWLNSDARDAKLRNQTGDVSGAKHLDLAAAFALPDLGPWSELLKLVAGWRVLGELSVRLGRDPAVPNRCRKVGNPMAQEATP